MKIDILFIKIEELKKGIEDMVVDVYDFTNTKIFPLEEISNELQIMLSHTGIVLCPFKKILLKFEINHVMSRKEFDKTNMEQIEHEIKDLDIGLIQNQCNNLECMFF